MPHDAQEKLGEIICEHCHMRCEYDQTQRCWRCDGLVCMHCLEGVKEPLCPDCRENLHLMQIQPMLAANGTLPDDDENWAFEFKWDGARAMGYWDGTQWRLRSRNLLDITTRYPELAQIGEALGERDVILDGEIVALDEAGKPSFQRLQRRMHVQGDFARAAKETPIVYFVFDVLWLDGRSTIKLPFSQRRQLLESLDISRSWSRISPCFRGHGADTLNAARQHNLEGIIAKRLASPYEPGSRSGSWRKIKLVFEQEFIVGGWTGEKNDPNKLGSLLLGCFNQSGQLEYVGSVGTGWDERAKHGLLVILRKLDRPVSAFVKPAVRRAHHVAPKLIVRVEYRRWPGDGQVQQASYKGLVDDRPIEQVTCQAQQHMSQPRK